MTETAIRIVIADDHALFRQVLRKLLEEEPDLQVVEEVCDGLSVCEALDRTSADLLLLDLEMPGFNGYDVLRQLKNSHRFVDTIVLTASEDETELSLALELGAKGVVPKKAAPDELILAIRKVYQGLSWLDRSIRDLLPSSVLQVDEIYDQWRGGGAKGRNPQASKDLTPREAEIASLVADGLRYKEIARRLKMSPHTLNNHLRNIFEKLQIHGRVELALYGLRRKF